MANETFAHEIEVTARRPDGTSYTAHGEMTHHQADPMKAAEAALDALVKGLGSDVARRIETDR